MQARLPEIEEAARTRVFAISEPSEVGDPEYAMSLRGAVAAALGYALDAIEYGEDRSPPVPAELLAQAHAAAQNGVSLDTVLRRYFAGYTLLGDFLVQEVAKAELQDGLDLNRLLRNLATLFDRLIDVVSQAYEREACARPRTENQRRARRVDKLLAGELIDPGSLAYELEAFHLGIVARGSEIERGVRDLAAALDRGLLLVRREEGALWAWLGGSHEMDPARLEKMARAFLSPRASMGVGESGWGLAGWRLTHKQAKAAHSIGLRSSEPIIRYADVALLAAILKDHTLEASLRQIYLDPLLRERDGGGVARQTLRAYIAAECNVTSAAAALGISRNTVASRLRTIETTIGRPLSSSVADLDIALRLEELLRRRPMAFAGRSVEDRHAG